MENSQHIKKLYQKYLDNEYSEQELDELLEYFYHSPEHHDLSAMIKAELENNEEHVQSEAVVKSLLAELDLELFTEIEKRKKSVKTIKLWPRIVGAAAAAAVIVFGIWFYNARHPEGSEATRDLLNYAKNDIAPGKNGATITLANGKVIALSDAKSGVVVGGEEGLVYDDNTSVISSDNTVISNEVRDLLNSTDKGSLLRRDDGRGVDGKGANGKGGEAGAAAQMLTASTAKGQTYQFTLPDGTRVWLNADSKISFPSQFIGKERKILLYGEGYFEVSKNKEKPFIVQTDKQEVTVLGTHFNINSYANEGSVTTTLLEGSVKVSRHPDDRSDLLNSTDKRSLGALEMTAGRRDDGRGGMDNRIVGDDVVLKPNQQSVISGSNRIAVKDVDANEAIDWKSGQFVFNDEPLESIMRKVARWYDVEVIYKDADPKALFYGSVSRYSQVSKILSKLEVTGGIHFKVEGRKIYVSK
ncbi:FecR family protein [Pedobacter ginsengisoli]|uniref:FecR family protein n=1 Tax=Pedobacter ginsengisoli TaxID=363852 RepID=UPI00254B99C9|nr:FecR family protein [Pedobacter ginsengisoli]